MKLKKLAIILLLTILAVFSGWAGVAPRQPNSGEIQIMLKKLTVFGNVLYIGAHPDDENTAVLAALSLERGLRVGYLSLTRGDGGQNLLGSEQNEWLGIIRTQELLQARQLDHAEQFFTRAIDFGYSKSAEESLRFWGHDAVLSDVVWIIRSFKPDVIITRFLPDSPGHGHHQASAILAEEAFAAAADPSRFPEQLKYVAPWQAKRLLWNRSDFGGQAISDADKAASAKLSVGDYNPLLGLSYTEIAALSRSMHKSQGMGAAERRGESIAYFKLTAGQPAQADLMDGIDTSWKRIAGGEPVGAALEEAFQAFRPTQPSLALPALVKAYRLIQQLPADSRVARKKEDIAAAIQACAGLWLEATTQEASATPGSLLPITITALNRLPLPPLPPKNDLKTLLERNPGAIVPPASPGLVPRIPANRPYTQPYWLVEPKGKNSFTVKDQEQIGQAESPPSQRVKLHVVIAGELIEYTLPVLYRWVDPIQGERYRAFSIVPEVSVALKDNILIFADQNPKAVPVTVTSNAAGQDGSLQLRLPQGWKAQPETFPLKFGKKGEVQNFVFQVSPIDGAPSGRFSAVATIAGKEVSVGTVNIDYPHITPQTALERAEGKLIRLDLKKNGRNIGYIMGSGDFIPEALRQVGYRVTLLSDEELAGADLSPYDAIIAGIRAYSTRPALKTTEPRLLDYVKQGGAVVVQYNLLAEEQAGWVGPYRFHISRERVSVEDAPITVAQPNHPLLNYPNKITAADFEGWIQERGLYFADRWDEHYETIISCHDPNEPDMPGGLLMAHYGKGVYIYTGYSWFRQLPAGVPGAYRLFVNLISAGGKHDK